MSFHSAPAATPCLAPRGASSRPAAGRTAAKGSALGKSSDRLTGEIAETNERAKWSSKRAAAKILFNDENPRLSALGKRISGCGYWNHSAFVDLQRNKATGQCSYKGTTSCGSVWACPVCSSRISAKRQQELNDLLSRARAAGYSVFMLTQTFAHQRGDDLQVILDGFKASQKRFRQLRGWRALKDIVVGTVQALELTHGENAHWHPHAHILVICKGDPASAFARLDALRASWLAALESAGLSGGRAAWQLQDASAAAGYIAKWGAGEELALHGAKSGRNGSRTPFKILADARDGCRRSAALFAEYVAAMIGRRQLIWSNGLKALFQIGEVSDADAAQEADPPSEVETVRSWTAAEWRHVRLRRVAVQFAAQEGRCIDAAIAGPSDAMLWQRYRDEAAVVDLTE